MARNLIIPENNIDGRDGVPSEGRHSKASLAEEWILRQIAEGHMHPGTFIDKGAVATALGVSRQPVNTALDRLARRGVVYIVPQLGTYVAKRRRASTSPNDGVCRDLALLLDEARQAIVTYWDPISRIERSQKTALLDRIGATLLAAKECDSEAAPVQH